MSEAVSLVVRGPADVVSFLSACGVPGDEPTQIVLGLAVTEADLLSHTVCGAAVRTGPAADGPVDPEHVIAIADELVVGAVVLATVDPAASPAPGRPELARFVALRRACADSGVVLLDWIVLHRHRWWSLREQVLREAA